MARNQSIPRGTVMPDGKLELDHSPGLPPGPVEVIVRSVKVSDSDEDWWQSLQRARADTETNGTADRSVEDIQKEREDFRSGDERLVDVDREHESGKDRWSGFT